MSTETIQQNDEILGYKLTRKLGSGGYGDVWEADAPGGLKKAVKIIFGYHDEKRAQAELKALDRIKEARHPFLLSLERIEVFNSKLIIVSELAEQSLANLVNVYGDRSESGIPRDELVGYMRDAAGALDYLNGSFGLQHLDIKPENLLLVSGHAKVADFGLVKDIKGCSQSLMSGMTPSYAAPELFDGQPGQASDQYSLAVVYQEMLTMARPFPGSTPAQLAAQHMHGKPDLRALPISDQPVIAKALSKNPADRYQSCLQFVEQLANRKSRKKVIRSRTTVRQNIDTGSETVVFGGSGGESKLHTELFSESQLTFNNVELTNKEAPECHPKDSFFQPTLVIGVGNSSSSVLQKVKDRIVARHQDANHLPSFGLLCIDSDRDGLSRLSVGRGDNSISVGETLAIPLRRSDQYRQKANLDLSWISRRWIYNVPRSGQTEGLRPLGRLVFVDHFDSICDKLTSCLKEITREENIAKSCETLGLNPPPEVRPKIILVSNIAGGLGSGMTNDLAYTLRLMVAEQGMTECDLIGMLMFGDEAVGREPGLATANAYAYLSELRHFADGGYPGDSRIGIPEFDEELPFDHAYAIRLRTDKDSQIVPDQDKIAEYICLSSTTSCKVFFDAGLKQDRQEEEFTFRSFGVSVCGPGLQVQGRDSVERLSKDLIDQWINEPRQNQISVPGFCRSSIEDFGITLESATEKTLGLIADLPEWKMARSLVERAPESLLTGHSSLDYQSLSKYFDGIFDTPYYRRENVGIVSDLCQAVDTEISTEAQIIGDGLSMRILELLNTTNVSFLLLNDVLEACNSIVSKEQDAVVSGLKSFGKSISDMQAELELSHSNALRTGWAVDFIQRYSKIRLQEFAMRCNSDLYRVLKSCLTSTEEMLKRFRLQLDAVGQSFDVQPATKRTAKYTPTIQQMLVDSVNEDREDLVLQVEKIVLDGIRANGESVLEVLSDSVNWQQNLPTSIIDASQSVLSNAFKKVSIDDVIAKSDIQPAAVKSWLNEQLNDATPFVTDCGGEATLLLGQPQYTSESKMPQVISECFDLKPREIKGTTGDFVLCFEVDRVLLANLAFSILKDSPEATEIVKRIQSRTDIDWTTLEDLM
ncbi:MAG: tubulin-like doman-containing protein [Planctomycetota bacterium]